MTIYVRKVIEMNKVNLKAIGMTMVCCLLVACSADNSNVKSDASRADSKSVNSCCQDKGKHKCLSSRKPDKPDCCKAAPISKSKAGEADKTESSKQTKTES